jgi:hypothetical protein
MVNQLYKLGDRYEEWVHLAVNRKMRIFDSDFLEWFASNKFSTILAYWSTFIIFLILHELNNGLVRKLLKCKFL